MPFNRPQKRPKVADTVTNDTPKLSPSKKQPTITSYFSTTSGSKPTKIEFVGIDVKKRRSAVPVKAPPQSPQKQEVVETAEHTFTGVKNCPFYKKIYDTSFAVDAFSYGNIPGIKFYFLSHFHYDHYQGLNKQFSKPIFCSKITANLVTLKIGVNKKYLNICSVGEPFIVDGVVVEIMDANHCPGSVMFLFKLPDGQRILHTGDFRATSSMMTDNRFLNINCLYLDTTYLDPQYSFPSQDSIIEYVADLVQEKLIENPKILVVCGSYTIGKERLFLAIARKCGLKIWAAPYKRKVLNYLEDDFLSGSLVTNEKQAQIHVLSMNQLSVGELHRRVNRLEGAFDEIVAFRPTGWTFHNSSANVGFGIVPRRSGCISVYDVPYSEHSSFLELKNFVQKIRPKKVIPTVVSHETIRRMNVILKVWVNQ